MLFVNKLMTFDIETKSYESFTFILMALVKKVSMTKKNLNTGKANLNKILILAQHNLIEQVDLDNMPSTCAQHFGRKI